MVATGSIGVIEGLLQLTAVCRESADLFRTAAGNVKSPILNAQFNSYAQQRDLLAAELEAVLRGPAEAPMGGRRGADIAGGWMPPRPAGTDAVDDGALIAASIRSEEGALERYARALRRILPPDIRIMLERQHEVIQESRRHLDDLRRHYFSVDPSAVPAPGRMPVRRKGVPGRRRRGRAGAKRQRPGGGHPTRKGT